MDRFIQILFIFSVLILVCSAEEHPEFNQENQTYDVKSMTKKSLLHIQNFHRLESELTDFQFRPLYQNFVSGSIETLLGNSTKCFRDLIYFVQNLNVSSGQWALKMLDSFGKLDSGLLQGSLKWVGEYKECIQVSAPPNNDSTAGNFHGQYCFLNWLIPMSNMNVTLTTAVCLPDSCSDTAVSEVLNILLSSIMPPLMNQIGSAQHTLTCKPKKDHLNTPSKAVIALMSFFCFLVILGSSVTCIKHFLKKYDFCSRKSLLIISDPSGDLNRNAEEDFVLDYDVSPGRFHGILKKCGQFLECFCVFRNGAKFLNTKVSEGELLCIHGIRFLSMSWVILGHTFSFCSPSIRNMYETIDLTKNLAFQVILQGVFSVDSFFVLSGFLLTYLSMQEFNKNKGGINWPYFYIHRYLRLTPIYMVVIGFYTTVFLYLSSGPFSSNYDLDPVCKDNWWWNLLYINNFAKANNQCMNWTWYLANDMQFFIISPLFLISLWRWPKVGYGLIAIFLCVCWLCNFILTYRFDLLPGISYLLDYPLGEIMIMVGKYNDYFQKVYVKPYTRIGPYLVGMLTGYILFARKRNNVEKHSFVTLCMGWIFASITTLVCIYGLYRGNPSLIARSFYNAFSHTIYAVGLCWVIYVCLVEQGGAVNSLLSFKMFIPLSRLTYAAYLIHPLIIHGYFDSLQKGFEYSHPTLVVIYLGAIVATYAISLPVSLVFESPIIALEKLIRTSLSKKKEQSNL